MLTRRTQLAPTGMKLRKTGVRSRGSRCSVAVAVSRVLPFRNEVEVLRLSARYLKPEGPQLRHAMIYGDDCRHLFGHVPLGGHEL